MCFEGKGDAVLRQERQKKLDPTKHELKPEFKPLLRENALQILPTAGYY